MLVGVVLGVMVVVVVVMERCRWVNGWNLREEEEDEEDAQDNQA